MKTVSIVIPVYNASGTLRRCFDSIRRQTYPDFEVIAVDDGSADDSLDICKEYAAKDRRFSALPVPHGGVSRARNAGIRHAKGYYLQLVDSDDTLQPQMLEKMVALLENNDADLAVCRFDHPFFKTYLPDAVYDLTDEKQLLALYQDTFAMVMPWNKVWKRELFTEPYDETVHFSEDELGNLANLPNVKRVATTSEYLYDYFIATKENGGAETSCINKIVRSPAFWKNKSSIYHLGAKLLPKRRAVIEDAVATGRFSVKEADDLAYLRLLDYAFWQIPVYIGMNVPKRGMTEENLHVFSDGDFLKGFAAQEKYGFRLKKMRRKEKRAATEKFTGICYEIYRRKNAQADFRIAYCFLSVFLALFAEQTGKLDVTNFNARFLADLESDGTPEARLAKELLYDAVPDPHFDRVLADSYA